MILNCLSCGQGLAVRTHLPSDTATRGGSKLGTQRACRPLLKASSQGAGAAATAPSKLHVSDLMKNWQLPPVPGAEPSWKSCYRGLRISRRAALRQMGEPLSSSAPGPAEAEGKTQAVACRDPHYYTRAFGSSCLE